MSFAISADFIASQNESAESALAKDFHHLGRQLARRGLDIEYLTKRAMDYAVAVPTWGVGTGGTRFARFPGPGEPRNIYDKLADCEVIHQLSRATPNVSPHFPWDKVSDYSALRQAAASHELGFDAVNSNTFQDQRGQERSYKFGSLTHADKATRQQAVEHNIECIDIGRKLGSTALTVWIADGSNFPGQSNLNVAFDRYMESLAEIYGALPKDWLVFLEHKLYEPAFYATVISDWGSNFMAASELGPKAKCLVDLGHHAPNTNIEQIVARLIRARKLAGFHFNDSKYGDDDLDSGSVNPFRLFLVFNELVDAEMRKAPDFAPAYMIDQSHNVTDPIESLIGSSIEILRAYVQASLVDRAALTSAQQESDVTAGHRLIKQAYNTDVSPILAEARRRKGGAIDPVATYRASGYRNHKAEERPATGEAAAGIVSAMGQILEIRDLQALARRRVPRMFYDYADSGAYTEGTYRANEADFRNVLLRQRVAVDISNRSLASEMIGQKVAMPVALAPTGMTGMQHADGEILAARAAQKAGVPFTLSTMSICSIEDVAEATGMPFWFQLYVMNDRGFVENLIDRAKAAKCSALVLTLDLQILGQRHKDIRNGLSAPPRLTLPNLLDMALKPRWCLSMLGTKRRTFRNIVGHAKGVGDLASLSSWTNEQFDPHLSWADVEWIKKRWGGKLILKGILDPEDAKSAVATGADAIIVSNHGGRQLDGASSSIAMLPKIVDAMGDKIEVHVDGGIRSGQDVLKALCLGAKGAYIGRAFLYGLAAMGEAGVALALQIIAKELDVTMALCGERDVKNLGRHNLLQP